MGKLTLEGKAKLRKYKVNDNIVNQDRVEALKIIEYVKKKFNRDLLGEYVDTVSRHAFKRVNLWNLSPKQLANWRWYSKFELSLIENIRKDKQLEVKSKIKLINGGDNYA